MSRKGPAVGGGQPGQAAGRSKRAAARAADLERRYGRLLAAYPRDHRTEHAAEMLGVLMAGARPGQSRPAARESVNLLAGALRIRLRRAVGSFAAPAWRDALAVASVLAPVIGLTFTIDGMRPGPVMLGFVMSRVPAAWWAAGPGQMLVAAGWTAVLAAVLLQRRRAAAGAALLVAVLQLLTAVLGAGVGGTGAWSPTPPAAFYLGVVAMVAALGSDGPGRGLRLLGRWWTAAIIAGLPVFAALRAGARFAVSGVGPAGRLSLLFVLARDAAPAAVHVLALAAVFWLFHSLGRRTLGLVVPAVLAPEVLRLAMSATGASFLAPGSAIAVLWTVYVTLAVAVAALVAAGRWDRPGWLATGV